ncbi:MAG: DNA-directed RNA polymerase subunit alpha [Actinomycetota bacterium]|nr:DNA-directed RNA polymerase subunit alpha [Actinomycetota bacterium]MDD5666414.1 DNA-directed RNA polymerase subunit alpha [Actinomycetota bacterium]
MVLEMQKPHIVVDKLEDSYGRFIIEPLERGLGHTLGNSMRRILLSSIPGGAITSIRIEGVMHEFSTIEGIKEDSMDMILNLKGVILRIEGEGQFALSLDITGPKAVTAKNIEVPDGVEIVNPDLKICTLNKKARLKMELTAQKGRGYVSAEHIGGYREVAGSIPLDAMFSPVVSVSYQVEDTRVGQRTDYDRLILDINTNGSIDAREALLKAAQILAGHVGIFTSLAEGEEEEGEPLFGADLKPAGSKDWQLSIEDLELPVRVLNCLHRGGINTVGQLVEKTEEDLLALRSFGARSIEDVKEKLEKRGLKLRSKEG